MKPLELILDLLAPLLKPEKEVCRNVLILEDDETEGAILSRVVKSCGFQPMWFNSQRDAERAMEHDNFCFGIFDLRLPGGDGEVARRNFQTQFPDAPTLIVSGSYDALLKVIQSGVTVWAQWKGNDFRFVEATLRDILSRIKRNGNGNRWTSKEVLLFLLILAASNWGVWKLCQTGILVTKLP